jgi:hypothetical protein
MKIITKQNTRYILRFDLGEEVIGSLKDFARKNKVKSASFAGLGAASEIMLSFYNLKTKKYEDKNFKKEFEITNLNGNIAHLDKEIIVHCHGNFSDNQMKVVGGHVKKLLVSGTCEIALSVMNKKISRAYNSLTGLNLMK